MTEPTFGITITRDDNEARPVVVSDMSVVGLVGTAPAADAAAFPLDTPVLVYSSDITMLTKLGATGTLRDQIALINAQLADFQVAAKVVVVRVAPGVDAPATIANILGVEADGSGLFALLQAGPILGVIPRLIGVPGYTHQVSGDDLANPVCAALPGILSKLIAHAVVEGPGTNATAIKNWRETLASGRLIPVDAWTKVQHGVDVVSAPGVGAILGVAVRRDYEKRGVPGHSWANQPINGILGPNRYVNFSLTDGATEGQDLLSNNIGVLLRGELGVETAISASGFVFVGTDNADTDPLWQFYNVTRMRDYIHLGLLRTLRFYLGKFNITRQTIQAVLNTMHGFLRDLKADDHILGFKVGFEPDKNSPENLRLGRFRCYFEAEEPPVLRRIDIDSRRYAHALEVLVDDLASQTSDLVG
ncbi:phage tail protein [Rhodopseudomonas sp. P2A-2r]|uniref:phage tail sheath family protein n=1 Tax=Rhodopseudomonas sp. P2A-2r TaxID=2991972 RepID=UPI002234740F|nr:phage tail sheath C-terminal domain-containing protein [Rhodopseudomonas sp. P2A-2r]UZE51131.1 phage tail protein [Rhodopseudomonas sp. P2A-2r]